jgi:hypothetical protein
MDQIVDRIVASESRVLENLRQHRPLIETYLQNTEPHPELGSTPKGDQYFLGKVNWDRDKFTVSMMPGGTWGPRFAAGMTDPFGVKLKYGLDGFASMMFVDTTPPDRQRYDYRFVRREFLGEVRCLVFDVKPRDKRGSRFAGRIWANDQDYTIVRINGAHGKNKGLFGGGEHFFHFDSWRMNLGPGLWLPAVIYTEESGASLGIARFKKAQFKAQTRLWGYDLKQAGNREEFTAILVEAPSVRDQQDDGQEMSPVLNQREWERHAENNILERLERAGLLAPRGPVDAVLDTVVNNIQITNKIVLEPPVQCRVLLTSPLESFTIGHTIVLSRGLIDVLPDESALALMLAHELAHIQLGQRLVDTKYGFQDRLMIEDTEILNTFRFARSDREEEAADAKAVEFIKSSPYADKLETAGLFLRAVAENARRLPSLIQPHLGDRLAKGRELLRLMDVMKTSPELEPTNKEQIAALPLGGRVRLDPWSNNLELVKAKPVAIQFAREKMPFEVTPFMPHLKQAKPPGGLARTDPSAD